MDNKFIIAGLVILGLALSFAFLWDFQKENINLDSCIQDSDCVPASCCHPNSCVLKADAPDCKGIVCSAECKFGTLDCGQGECRCIKNKCEAVIK